ncbi:hypothetical protein B0H67DRAFT_114040 [Lasiosphaeris hirsuta]|uniref:THUMP domain-containing protein n=1 Tax=Lasiosphaeris hirsuta TaxID=260670 RepID=A0AA40E2M0_9PEZI|nr:hypothetical protein B0H67DRAFT_114040 [Lasiosphaeris hirsuta]
MSGSGKRKDAPADGGGRDGSKKKKTGNAGKWKTAHQQAKQAGTLQAGDQGIWVTCARHQEAKASREISLVFSEYAEKLYGIMDKGDTDSNDGDIDDLEASIQKEVDALKAKGKADGGEERIFTPMTMNVDCLLFFKTRAPVEPVAFVKRICADAKAGDSGQLKCRYVNRLTPVVIMGKATGEGLVEVAKKALAPFFEFASKPDSAVSGGERVEGSPESKGSSFAIRPTMRNHNTLKRDFVINTVASLINQDRHKVNLTSPDKVILIDIYQSTCGMSVVDGDWDGLKRYNLSELYTQAMKSSGDSRVNTAENAKEH